MPNGTVGTKVVLAFGDGSTLVSSPGGDLYWFVYPDGTSVQCPLQQASRYWMQYEDSLQVGPTAPQYQERDSVQSPVGYVPPQPTTAPRRVQEYQGSQDYSPWQQELLQKLGLTETDLDPTGSMRRKNKRKD